MININGYRATCVSHWQRCFRLSICILSRRPSVTSISLPVSFSLSLSLRTTNFEDDTSWGQSASEWETRDIDSIDTHQGTSTTSGCLKTRSVDRRTNRFTRTLGASSRPFSVVSGLARARRPINADYSAANCSHRRRDAESWAGRPTREVAEWIEMGRDRSIDRWTAIHWTRPLDERSHRLSLSPLTTYTAAHNESLVVRSSSDPISCSARVFPVGTPAAFTEFNLIVCPCKWISSEPAAPRNPSISKFYREHICSKVEDTTRRWSRVPEFAWNFTFNGGWNWSKRKAEMLRLSDRTMHESLILSDVQYDCKRFLRPLFTDISLGRGNLS